MNIHVDQRNRDWTEEREQKLVNLVRDGLSAAQIRAELGGVTRNAVIGKIHRMQRKGLCPALARPKGFNEGTNRGRPRTRKSASVKNGEPLRASLRQVTVSRSYDREEREADAPVSFNAPKPQRPAWRDAPIPSDAPAPLNLTLMQLTDSTCKWPVDGEKEHTLFCGLSSVAGRPWCQFHCARSSGSFIAEAA